MTFSVYVGAVPYVFFHKNTLSNIQIKNNEVYSTSVITVVTL